MKQQKVDALKIWSNLHLFILILSLIDSYFTLFRVCPHIMFQISWFPPQAGESELWGEKVQWLLKDLGPVFLTAMSELICRVLKFTECSTLIPKMASDVKRKQNYKWHFACPIFSPTRLPLQASLLFVNLFASKQVGTKSENNLE